MFWTSFCGGSILTIREDTSGGAHAAGYTKHAIARAIHSNLYSSLVLTSKKSADWLWENYRAKDDEEDIRYSRVDYICGDEKYSLLAHKLKTISTGAENMRDERDWGEMTVEYESQEIVEMMFDNFRDTAFSYKLKPVCKYLQDNITVAPDGSISTTFIKNLVERTQLSNDWTIGDGYNGVGIRSGANRTVSSEGECRIPLPYTMPFVGTLHRVCSTESEASLAAKYAKDGSAFKPATEDVFNLLTYISPADIRLRWEQTYIDTWTDTEEHYTANYQVPLTPLVLGYSEAWCEKMLGWELESLAFAMKNQAPHHIGSGAGYQTIDDPLALELAKYNKRTIVLVDNQEHNFGDTSYDNYDWDDGYDDDDEGNWSSLREPIMRDLYSTGTVINHLLAEQEAGRNSYKLVSGDTIYFAVDTRVVGNPDTDGRAITCAFVSLDPITVVCEE